MKKIIKYLALLILPLLNYHLSISQNFSLQSFVFTKVGWVNVTEEVFESFRIPSEKIEVFDTRNKDLLIVSLDSVLARIFIDKSGKSYFWVNCSYGREKLTSKIFSSTFKKEPTFSSKTRVITDSISLADEAEFLKVVSKITGDFIIKPIYTINPVTGKEVYIYGFDMEDGNLVIDRRSIVLKDVTSGKEVLISGKDTSFSGLNYLLNWLYASETIKEGLEYFLYLNNRQYGAIGLNVDFLKPYFEISIPQAFQNLPNYKPMDIKTFLSMSRAIERLRVGIKKTPSKNNWKEKRITIDE